LLILVTDHYKQLFDKANSLA